MKAIFETKELLDAIKTIKGSIADKKVEVLSKVCMTIKGYYVEFATTDSKSLTLVKTVPSIVELSKDDTNSRIVFDLNILEKSLKDTTSKSVTITTTLENMPNFFEFDNGIFKAYIIKENLNYPKYEGLIGYTDDFQYIGKNNPDDEYKIGLSKKLLTDILKSYDNKQDDILEFTFNKNDNLRAVYIRPHGLHYDRKVSLLMPIKIR